jgi:uncharacterized membrane protein
MPDTDNPSGLSDNAVAAISYITIIPAIAFLVLEPYKRSAFVRFHAWQSIFLFLAAFLVSFVLDICLGMMMFFTPFLVLAISRLIWLAWVLLWIVCVINAVNGKRFKLPIIGALAEKQAGSPATA